MSKAMVVLSGGQDSTTCLFIAKNTYDEVHAVTFDYGQKHAIEIEAAKKIAQLAGVASHEIIAVPNILRSTSPLLDKTAELEKYSDYESMDKIIGNRVELTFVPMRNAFFLTLAANIAISKGCFNLFTGVCQNDNSNYPDCRQAFIESQQRTIDEALGIDFFIIEAPLLHLSKADTVKLAMELPGCHEAMAYSHTCYSGTFPPCGECHSCVLRAKGFTDAGVPDPLLTRAQQ